MEVIVLGSGLVGNAIARDLAKDDIRVTVTDINQQALDPLKEEGIKGIKTDLSNLDLLKTTIADFDLVIGALPGYMGFKTLKTVIEAGKDIVDISFFPEDAFLLDDLAKKKEVTAVVDCGIAPGCSNIILGHESIEMDEIHSFECYVGGLPIIREWPLEYKAPFSPIDILEEYTRPARYVKNGKLVVKPALSEPELLNFPKMGTLEAFNSDGLRSLLHTFPEIPDMIEKTLRYPGHCEKMRMFRELGFFSREPIQIAGTNINPIDITTKLLFPHWKYEKGEEDLTVLQLIIKGKKDAIKVTHQYDLLDKFDRDTNTLSMARTTGYTCSIVARLIHKGMYKQKGIIPPEFLGQNNECYQEIMEELKKRKIIFNRIVD